MAFSASAVWEVQTGGNDTNNGGGFDPGGCTFAADLAGTNANTASPVVTSASYTFAAGDVGHWVYVSAGTNWTPGWYKIASVDTGAATLDAAVGHAVSLVGVPNTVAGCATVASPASGSFTVDYSQGTSPIVTYDGATNYMTIDGTTNTKMTATGVAFGVNHIGNIVNVTGPAGFTVQRVQIKSIAAGAVTVDKSLGTLGTSNGTGYMGGCLASVGKAAGLLVAGNDMWVKSGTHSMTSSSANVAGGRFAPGVGGVDSSNPCRFRGYGSVRGDKAARPVIQAGVNMGNNYLFVPKSMSLVEDIVLDANAKTGVGGFSTGGSSNTFVDCKVSSWTWGVGFYYANIHQAYYHCEATGGSGSATYGFHLAYCIAFGCIAHDNTCTGFYILNGCTGNQLLSYENSGGGSDGFELSAAPGVVNCVAYHNGQHGFNVTDGPVVTLVNCVAESNHAASAYGFTGAGIYPNVHVINCASYDNTTDIHTTNLRWSDGFIAQTAGSFFVDAPNDDFRLNSTAGRGALLRAAGVGPLLQTNAIDIGAVQHADPIAPGSLPDAKYVYNAIDRGDGVTGTLRASNIASGAGAPGVDLAATDLKDSVVVDDVTGSYTGGGVIIVED